MANSSHLGGEPSERKVNDRVVTVQVLVSVFLLINFLLITTFFMKDVFYTTMRYVLFAVTLTSDCLFLFMTNILLIMSYFHFTIQMWLCLLIYIVLSVYTFVTPVALTAMSLERYVAICMPLRHSELCSTRSSLHCILIIHSLSSLPCIIVLSMVFASATYSFYTQSRVCSVEVFIIHRWQGYLRAAMSQLYFLLMCITIVFSYVKIVKVAKTASGEDKKSTWKGLKTVILHGFQLLLCLTQLWTPFIEDAVRQIDFMLFINVRNMTNSSHLGGEPSERKVGDQVIIVQVLVAVFLLINFLLITTFLMKDVFYTTMRYMLFAVTLTSDCLFLFMTNILLIMSYFRFTIQMWLCLLIYIVLSVYTFVTPVALTAMSLERYVAICMPLRHSELCSTRSSLRCILIIHSLSSLPCIIVLSIFFASATYSFYTQSRVCSVEVFIIHRWQGYLRAAMSQLYFLLMCITIVFSYVKIMKVAKTASGEDRKSTWKGLKTVILHGFQLLLCLTQLWTPFIEDAVRQIDFMLFINVRYFNYITFILTPRCLSPLIYGLRDEMFFQALRYYALCGLYKKSL
ncbi:uncharacterized protein V6R79_004186 [Siganus canaliculatus]